MPAVPEKSHPGTLVLTRRPWGTDSRRQDQVFREPGRHSQHSNYQLPVPANLQAVYPLWQSWGEDMTAAKSCRSASHHCNRRETPSRLKKRTQVPRTHLNYFIVLTSESSKQVVLIELTVRDRVFSLRRLNGGHQRTQEGRMLEQWLESPL